jgi:hypothetical protein
MKRRAMSVVVLAAIVLVAAAATAGPALARAVSFTVTQTYLGETAPAQMWNDKDGNHIVEAAMYRDDGSDWRVTGRTTGTTNWLLSQPGTSPSMAPTWAGTMWGTMHTEVGSWSGDVFAPAPRGEYWEGAWSGSIFKLPTGLLVASGVTQILTGHNGKIEGMTQTATVESVPEELWPVMSYVTGSFE